MACLRSCPANGLYCGIRREREACCLNTFHSLRTVHASGKLSCGQKMTALQTWLFYRLKLGTAGIVCLSDAPVSASPLTIVFTQVCRERRDVDWCSLFGGSVMGQEYAVESLRVWQAYIPIRQRVMSLA